jgi:hypothetical protein
MSKAKSRPARKSATKRVTDREHEARRQDIVAKNLMRKVDVLIAQSAVCAAAAWVISEDDGDRPREAAASMPLMLDSIRERLITLHSDIEFLLSEERRP